MNPIPIVTTPHEKAIELNKTAGPTLLRTRLLGSWKMTYYPSNILVNQFSSQSFVGNKIKTSSPG